VDPDTPSGEAITIEHRAAGELARGFTPGVLPEQVAVYNPAFDVTPAELVTAFVTDRGIIRPPYRFEHARHAESVQG
jgi:methylthioribose-1-phosphate isomerase